MLDCRAVSDFHQDGMISTLHRLGETDLSSLENTLTEFTQDRPVARAILARCVKKA